jgi:iron complex transport system substrate-binding protein
MVGTAYLDDAIWPEFEDAYNKVPVLEESSYPTIESLSDADPDFIYASYRSAFEARTETSRQSRIEYHDWLEEDCSLLIEGSSGSSNSSYCRGELYDEGVPSYLQTPSCEISDFRPSEVTLEDLYQEINDVASVFGVQDNAESLIKTIEDHFQDALALHNNDEKPISVLFLDSWGDETPLVGGRCGSINAIIEYAGAENVFKDLGLEE